MFPRRVVEAEFQAGEAELRLEYWRSVRPVLSLRTFEILAGHSGLAAAIVLGVALMEVDLYEVESTADDSEH